MNETFNKTCLTGVSEEMTLAALLENCKKARIKSIASRYGIRLSDKNTKQQMIEAILPAIDVNFGIRLKSYTEKELLLLLTCFRSSSLDEPTAAAVAASAPFEDGGIFLAFHKEQYAAMIPRELAGKIMSRCAARCTDRTRPALARTADVCARIYGRFTPALLASAVNAAFDETVTPQQAEAFMQNASSDLFRYADGEAVCTFGAPDMLHPLADSLDYDLPSRREIDAYASFGLDASNYYYRQVVNLVFNNAGKTFEKATDLMEQIARWCVTGGNPAWLAEAVRRAGLSLNEAQFNYLLGSIGELAGETRRQDLKGHIYNQVEGTSPLVMPQVYVAPSKGTPVHIAPKIGRNDPCPCGSGKKYKKCCGRYQS